MWIVNPTKKKETDKELKYHMQRNNVTEKNNNHISIFKGHLQGENVYTIAMRFHK